MKKDQAL